MDKSIILFIYWVSRIAVINGILVLTILAILANYKINGKWGSYMDNKINDMINFLMEEKVPAKVIISPIDGVITTDILLMDMEGKRLFEKSYGNSLEESLASAVNKVKNKNKKE